VALLGSVCWDLRRPAAGRVDCAFRERLPCVVTLDGEEAIVGKSRVTSPEAGRP
jgi:hypothetical protein